MIVILTELHTADGDIIIKQILKKQHNNKQTRT